MRKMDFLRKVIPLTLSAGIILGIPAVLPGQVPAALVQQAEAAAKVQTASWTFQNDMEGWKYGGKWAYKGKPTVTQSKEHGGTVKLGVDYSKSADSSWSEVKLEYGKAASETLDIHGCNTVSYDFYFKPSYMTGGQFKTKVYAKDTDDKEAINATAEIDTDKAKDAGDGWKVAKVTITFQPAQKPLKYFMVSIVGCKTNYVGDVCIGKLAASWQKVPDGYVDIRTKVKKQTPLALKDLRIPQTVPLADKDATPRTAAVYGYMKAIADSDRVLYGHQNEMNKKASKLSGPSDTYDAVKDFPAIIGVDALALTGSELQLTDAEKAVGTTYSEKLAKLVLPAVKQGAILTMSCHMPNFDEVSKRPMKNGHYDYTGYSPNNTSGNVVGRIHPGGDLNAVYRGYLDMVAEFLGRMQKEDVPVIFRPFHENNGSWFWWGAAHCTPSEYKNLFRYTVEYLRDTKGLHNLIYAYSPGGPIADTADYLSRYPGDAFIDITGLDMYHHDPRKDDTWMKGFDQTMTVVDAFAAEHNKLAAVTEAGILVGNTGGALARTGNQRLDWFNEAMQTIAPHKMAYFLTWANFDEGNFDQPYVMTNRRGHEMINQFIDFYNSPQSVFAHQAPDLSKVPTKAAAAKDAYGYLTAPDAMERLLGRKTIRAHVAGNFQNAQFVLKKKDGTVAAVIPAVSAGKGLVKGEITAADLAKVGKTVGHVELQMDGQSADDVTVLFNMPAPPADPALVDDFESYYSDGGLLKAAYSTNCGAGCSVDALLSKGEERQHGDSGLDFHYQIGKGGYAGIVKSLHGVDWSQESAVQFWLKPDGEGQKLICQLNSGGEDFEADLTEYARSTQAQLVRIPFSAFKGKNGGTFDKSAVQHFGIYCNANGDKAVDSHIYFDDIRAVK